MKAESFYTIMRRSLTPGIIVSVASLIVTAVIGYTANKILANQTALTAKQTKLTAKQTDLTERQTRVMEQGLQPAWRVVPAASQQGHDMPDSIELWNDGAAVELRGVDWHSFIEVTKNHDTRDLATQYFFFHRQLQLSSDTRNHVLTLTAQVSSLSPVGQPVNITRCWRLLQEKLESIHVDSSKIRTFLVISYADALHVKKTEYLEFDSSLVHSGLPFGRRLSPAESPLILTSVPLVDLLSAGTDEILAAWQKARVLRLSPWPQSMLNAEG